MAGSVPKQSRGDEEESKSGGGTDQGPDTTRIRGGGRLSEGAHDAVYHRPGPLRCVFVSLYICAECSREPNRITLLSLPSRRSGILPQP